MAHEPAQGTCVSYDVASSDESVALRGLGLSEAELIELRSQGYLSRRVCTRSGATYWRLRFRLAGRLRTIYVGQSPELVAAVRSELALLQCPRDARLRRRRLVVAGKRRLRAFKHELFELLGPHGFHFHGDTLRRARAKNISVLSSNRHQ